MSTEVLVELRAPNEQDAAALRRAVLDVGGLERNSCYAYLLLCTHFAATCLVAKREEQLLGFVLGYRPPSRPDSLFVWQVGTAPHVRGTGLGRRMLLSLLDRPALRDLCFLTATVAPDNVASLALFRGAARALGVPCEVSRGFVASLFDEPHTDEHLVRVGPLKGHA